MDVNVEYAMQGPGCLNAWGPQIERKEINTWAFIQVKMVPNYLNY